MIKIIVAHDENRGIGKDNKIPWHIPEEFKFFKSTTIGNCCIMGRKTWDSLPFKPLKNRCNIVVSNTIQSLPDAFVCSSLQEAILKTGNNAFIIGGIKIYDEALSLNIVDEIYTSEIKGKYDCDTFFPALDLNIWNKVELYLNDKFSVFKYLRKN
jgi:dihydrofolate reductase